MSRDGLRRVLMFSYFYPPASTGVRRVLSLVRHLPSCGWEPVVLACRMVRGQGHDPAPLEDPAVARVPVERCGSVDPYRLLERWRPASSASGGASPVAAGGDSSRRVMDLARRFLFFPDDRCGWIPFAVLAAMRRLRRGRIDALYSSNYPNSSHAAAWIVHRLTGVPWLADFRDGWTQNPAFHRPGNALMAGLHRWGERRVARDATVVVTVSPPITDHLQRFRGDKAPAVETVYNGYEPAEWRDAAGGGACEGPLEPGRLTLLYAGTFFGRRRPDLLLAGLRLLLRREPRWRHRLRVRLRCVLDARALGLIERWGLGDVVQVLPPVGFAEVVAEQQRAEACLLILERGPGAEIMVSQKIFEYLAAGRPVYALVPEGAAARVLALTGGATVESTPDPTAAAASLGRFLAAVERGAHPLPDPAAVAAFDRAVQARRLAALLDRAALGGAGKSDLHPRPR